MKVCPWKYWSISVSFILKERTISIRFLNSRCSAISDRFPSWSGLCYCHDCPPNCLLSLSWHKVKLQVFSDSGHTILSPPPQSHLEVRYMRNVKHLDWTWTRWGYFWEPGGTFGSHSARRNIQRKVKYVVTPWDERGKYGSGHPCWVLVIQTEKSCITHIACIPCTPFVTLQMCSRESSLKHNSYSGNNSLLLTWTFSQEKCLASVLWVVLL